MDKSNLQFCAKQILIHWIQSSAPLERVVSAVFKDTAMGSSERRELQSRIFIWARYWPLFAENLDTRKIDSSSESMALVSRISEAWDWSESKWTRLHERAKPTFQENLRQHLLAIHGVSADILGLMSDGDLDAFHEYLHASLKAAPLAIRCRDLATRDRLIASHPELNFRIGSFYDLCLKTDSRWGALQSEEYQKGNFEIQDESSQLVSLVCDPKPGMKILDMCAGAGGKSLHLANLVGGKGEIHCWDPSHKKLQELQKRARRWGYNNVRALDESPKQTKAYDLVLVDAPCSSLGTLRRRPQLLASTSRQDFVRLQGLQRELLSRAFDLIKVTGTVVYATCSILSIENYSQVANVGKAESILWPELSSFLQRLNASPGAKISTIPNSDSERWCAQISAFDDFEGDGFFVARMSSR